MANYNSKITREGGGDVLTLSPGAVLKIGNMTWTVAADGNVIVTGCPTAEPAAVGALYANNGVLTIGNGP